MEDLPGETAANPLTRLADILSRRLGHCDVSGADAGLMGLEVDFSQSVGVGVRGAAQRERLQDALMSLPGATGAQVAEMMARRRGRSYQAGGAHDAREPLTYLERFGGRGESRELGMLALCVGGILEALWSGRTPADSDRAALLLVVLEQAALGRGNWDVAWLLTLEEDPPSQLYQRRATVLAFQTFAPLARQAWVTTALTYLRELGTLQTRRSELRRTGNTWQRGRRGQWYPQQQQQQHQGVDDQLQQVPGRGQPEGNGGKLKGKEKAD